MSATMRAPSLELLRLLRQSSPLSTCARSRPSVFLSRLPSRSLSTTHIKHAATSPRGRETETGTGAGSRGIQTSNSILSSSSPPPSRRNPYAPTTTDRGPASEEDTQTDFGAMDIYSNTPEPATSIDACTPGGFHLNNGTKITGGSGVLLAGGEAWSWKPWLGMVTNTSSSSSNNNAPGGREARETTTKTTSSSSSSSTPTPPPPPPPRITDLLDPRGLLIIPTYSLSLLKFLHPKPDLLLVGTGSRTLMLHPESRRYIVEELGLRVDVMDTANASAAYNLLATERGVDGGGGVGAAMLPVGWKGVHGKKKT